MKRKHFLNEDLIERSEAFMLGLAFLAVALYMAELLGVWQSLQVEHLYRNIALSIDFIFLLNLLVKMGVSGKSYINGPWFVIDLISTLPILSSISALPGNLEGLRFVRGFRLFRALRALRLLNVIPLLQFDVQNLYTSKEVRMFKNVVWTIIPGYALLFACLVNWLYSHYGDEAAKIYEFYLILGTTLGLLMAVIICRFQIPAIISAQVHKLLNVALPSQVANYFIIHPKAYYDTVKMPATIIFCDIKNFTSIVETLDNDLRALKMHLEAVLGAVTEVHRKYDLIIDKFIGDAIMSFRGGNLVDGTPQEHAWRIVKAALESRKAVQAINDTYFKDIKIGVASSSNALIGAFGTPTRLSYTILGSDVNLAARLESAVKQCKTENLICDKTYELLKNSADFLWRRFGKICVAGKSESFDVYEAFEPNDFEDISWIAAYHKGIAEYEKRRFEQAHLDFSNAFNLRPGGDPPSLLFMSLCMENLEVPPDEFWIPVRMISK